EGYWLAGARVAIEVGADVYETFTNSAGYFALSDVPAGQRTLKVSKGSFSAEQTVTVVPGETTQLQHVSTAPTTQMLVVTGVFDAVEDILQGLGFELRQCERADLHSSCPAQINTAGQITLFDGATSTDYITEIFDTAGLGQYDILFLNCGLN